MAAVATEALGEADIFDGALHRALKPLGVDAGLVYWLGPAPKEMILIRSVGLGEESARGLSSISDDQQARDLLIREGVERIMSFPLRSQGQTAGAILLGSRRRRGFRPDDLAAIEVIASLLGTALDNARARVRNREEVAEFEELAHLRAEWAGRLHALVQAGMVLTSDLSLPSLLQRLVDVAREVIGARYAALGVFEGHRLTRFVTSGIDAETVARIGDPPEGKGLLGALLVHNGPIRLRRLTDDPRAVGFPPNHPVMNSFLGVPLISHGSSVGNLYLTEKQGAPEFSQDDEALAITFGAQAAIAVENARLFEAASEASALKERNRIGQALQDAVARVLFNIGLESTEAADIGKLLDRLAPVSGPVPEDAARQMANGLRHTIAGEEPINERELQIIKLLAEGRSNKEIGEKLFLSENTIRYHIHKILQKLDVSRRIEIVRVAMERQLV